MEAKITDISIPIYLHDFDNATTFKRCRYLGRGSFAKCYAIMDVGTKKLYAGKIVSKSKQMRIEKVTKEIAIHKGLSHENIVKFYNFFDDEHYIYIVLELCLHSSMMELQKRREKITEYECRYYMMQIIQGVKYLHENGIIHRDLKLGNLFIDDNLKIKIGDFGLATCIEYEGERKNTICGTPNYVAPEILQGSGHSYNVDVWSIGCVMYTLLVGIPPFETSTVKETYKKIKRAEFQNPTFLSKQAAEMIMAMLSPNPNARPTINQLLDFEFMRHEIIPKQLSNILLTMPPPPSASASSDNIQRETTASGVMAAASANADNYNLLKIDYILDVKILYEELLNLIISKPILLTADLGDMYTEPAARPLLWVSKWVDYSDKYGFGYQLSDDTFGVVFNDMTKIILLHNHITVQYIDINGKETFMSTLEYDSVYDKKIKLLLAFKRYMTAELRKAGAHIMPEENENLSNIHHVHSWVRTASFISMHFTNGIIQFNFSVDHVKIILCSRMHTITRMDDKGHCQTYRFSTLMTHGLSQDLYQKVKKICGKLKMLL